MLGGRTARLTFMDVVNSALIPTAISTPTVARAAPAALRNLDPGRWMRGLLDMRDLLSVGG